MELNFDWSGNLPPDILKAVKEYAESYARKQVEAIVGMEEMRELTITVNGSRSDQMTLSIRGPAWLLARIKRGFRS